MIGLVNVLKVCRGLTQFEEVLALVSLLFVASGFLTFLSSHSPQGMTTLDRTADALFAAGLVALVASIVLRFA